MWAFECFLAYEILYYEIFGNVIQLNSVDLWCFVVLNKT